MNVGVNFKICLMPKQMCKLSKKEYLKKQKSGSDYFCKKCGREANKQKKLCKAVERLEKESNR